MCVVLLWCRLGESYAGGAEGGGLNYSIGIMLHRTKQHHWGPFAVRRPSKTYTTNTQFTGMCALGGRAREVEEGKKKKEKNKKKKRDR